MTTQPEGQTPRMADFLTIENANAEVDRLRLSIEGAGGWKDQCEERLQKIYAIQRENADLRQQLANEGKLREETADTLVRVIRRAEAAEARTVELQERLAMFEAITSGSQHMAVDRALLKGKDNGQ